MSKTATYTELKSATIERKRFEEANEILVHWFGYAEYRCSTHWQGLSNDEIMQDFRDIVKRAKADLWENKRVSW